VFRLTLPIKIFLHWCNFGESAHEKPPLVKSPDFVGVVGESDRRPSHAAATFPYAAG
jgi:hypothetical protein